MKKLKQKYIAFINNSSIYNYSLSEYLFFSAIEYIKAVFSIILLIIAKITIPFWIIPYMFWKKM